MMIMAPISGRLADRHGSRVLSSLGLLISGIGLLGYSLFTRVDMSMFEIILWGTIMGFGSGMFNSPNISTIMGLVPPERRGIAGSTRTMLMNAGSVISIAMAFAILSSGLTPQAMDALFIGAQIGGKGIFVDTFISDLRFAFFLSFIISIGATVISYMRGPTPIWKDASLESNKSSKEHAR
jgi:MFS family permease